MSFRGASLLLALAPALAADAAAAQGSLRFFGHGSGMIDRVKIRVDDPALPADPGPPVDVGASDFTLEFFLRGSGAENTPGGAISCNDTNIDWIYGNIVFDRDRFDQDRKFGLSIGTDDDVVVFGVSGDGTGDYTLCGTSNVLDGAWHHVAVQRRRSDGLVRLFVDGVQEGVVDGPDGDLSYPDGGVPGPFCGGPCDDSDPFLVIGAEKHDAGASFPSFSGWIDEVRVSSALRYPAAGFAVPLAPFTSDADTVALYHLDGPVGPCTGVVADVSGAAGGPSHGECRFGGAAPAGPLYSGESAFPAVPLPGWIGWVFALSILALARPAR